MRAAELCSVGRNAIYLWSKGTSRVPLDAAATLCRAAGVSLDWLVSDDPDVRDAVSRTSQSDAPDERATVARSSPAMADQKARLATAIAGIYADLVHPDDLQRNLSGSAYLPVIDARAAAGHGSWNDAATEIGRFAFPLAWLRKLGGASVQTKTCEFLRAYGDSMAPTITSGALLLIDRAQTRPPLAKNAKRRRDSEIFVFASGSDVFVKRLLQFDNDFIGVFSDNNADHPPTLLSASDAADLRIIGRVIWWDNRL